MATLIFAAARFPDLPELIGLRQTFIERYGTSVEAPVNQQVSTVHNIFLSIKHIYIYIIYM